MPDNETRRDTAALLALLERVDGALWGWSAMGHAEASNATSPAATSPDSHTRWDYCEIAVLCLFIAVGGPLNLRSLVRTLLQLRDGKRSLGQRFLLLKLNLIVADLLVIVVYAVSEVVWLATFTWEGGDVLCKAVKFLHMATFMAVSGSIVALAADRVYTTRNLRSVCVKSAQGARRTIAVVWLVVAAVASPQLFLYETFRPFPAPHQTFTQCSNKFNIQRHLIYMSFQAMSPSQQREMEGEMMGELEEVMGTERLYSGFSLLSLFWIPLLLVALSYASVVILLQTNIEADAISKSKPGAFRNRQSSGELTSLTSRNNLLLAITPKQRQKFKEKRASVEEDPQSDYQRYQEAMALNAKPQAPSSKSLSSDRLLKARNRALKESALFLLTWVITWSPYNVFALWTLVDPKSAQTTFSNYALLNNLIVLNAVINPVRELVSPMIGPCANAAAASPAHRTRRRPFRL